MLRHLRLHGLGVIDDAALDLGPGLTALTGETGAGKTLVTTGLGLLLGERADASTVRRGATRTVVEGSFDQLDAVQEQLEQAGAEIEDGEVLVVRQVSAQGRSRAMVGGTPVPLGVLSEITGELATIHGQSEQVRLGTGQRQREVLDAACGRELADELAHYRAAYSRRRALQQERSALAEAARERARQADLLTFGLDEIAAVDPQPGEDRALAAETSRLQAVDDLRLLAQRASAALSGDPDEVGDAAGASEQMSVARKDLEQMAAMDPSAAELAQRATDLGYQLTDLAAEVAGYLAGLDADPVRLEALTSRRAALAALTRKYGETIDEVLGWAETSTVALEELAGTDDRLAALHEQISALDDQVNAAAARISQLRQEGAARVETQVAKELAALALPHARLFFVLEPLSEPGPFGGEQVSLMFSANPGSEPAPLAKAASGGELSRIRLALEVTIAEPGHTFVFDEVDAGVGGAVALEIGRRLARLAQHSQVVVVTHLAQVAAFAQVHYLITKSTDGEVTSADIVALDEDARLAELARMMAGLESSATSLQHAQELLAEARQLAS